MSKMEKIALPKQKAKSASEREIRRVLKSFGFSAHTIEKMKKNLPEIVAYLKARAEFTGTKTNPAYIKALRAVDGKEIDLPRMDAILFAGTAKEATQDERWKKQALLVNIGNWRDIMNTRQQPRAHHGTHAHA